MQFDGVPNCLPQEREIDTLGELAEKVSTKDDLDEYLPPELRTTAWKEIVFINPSLAEKVSAVCPPGKKPGDRFRMDVDGGSHLIVVPEGEQTP